MKNYRWDGWALTVMLHALVFETDLENHPVMRHTGIAVEAQRPAVLPPLSAN